MKILMTVLIFAAFVLCAAFFSCDAGDDEVGGFASDDDDSADGSLGTNECGSYGDTGCDDPDERACEIGYLANVDRYENPEESDCAPNLQWSSELAQVALAHSKDMCENDYFDHKNKQGQDPFDRMDAAGIDWVAAGENLAMGTNMTPQQANTMWMNEPVCVHNHRSNLLSRLFTHVGVGVYDCGSIVYVTQDFATFEYSDLPTDEHGMCGPDF